MSSICVGGTGESPWLSPNQSQSPSRPNQPLSPSRDMLDSHRLCCLLFSSIVLFSLLVRSLSHPLSHYIRIPNAIAFLKKKNLSQHHLPFLMPFPCFISSAISYLCSSIYLFDLNFSLFIISPRPYKYFV